jgi:MATE family multidrug resistance protein
VIITVVPYFINLVDKESLILFEMCDFKRLKAYIDLAIPTAALLCLEWWVFEVLALLAGYLSADSLAAYVAS